MLRASITVCCHIEKFFPKETSVELQFGSGLNVLTPVEKWELKCVLEKSDEGCLFAKKMADFE